jgi:hypothetical protein
MDILRLRYEQQIQRKKKNLHTRNNMKELWYHREDQTGILFSLIEIFIKVFLGPKLDRN